MQHEIHVTIGLRKYKVIVVDGEPEPGFDVFVDLKSGTIRITKSAPISYLLTTCDQLSRRELPRLARLPLL